MHTNFLWGTWWSSSSLINHIHCKNVYSHLTIICFVLPFSFHSPNTTRCQSLLTTRYSGQCNEYGPKALHVLLYKNADHTNYIKHWHVFPCHMYDWFISLSPLSNSSRITTTNTLFLKLGGILRPRLHRTRWTLKMYPTFIFSALKDCGWNGSNRGACPLSELHIDIAWSFIVRMVLLYCCLNQHPLVFKPIGWLANGGVPIRPGGWPQIAHL